MTKLVKELLLKGATTAELRSEAVKAGMDTLRVSGLKKVPFVALKSDILNAVSQYYHHNDQAMPGESMEHSLQDSIEAFNSEYETDGNLEILHQEEEAVFPNSIKAVDDAPIIKLTNFILKQCHK